MISAGAKVLGPFKVGDNTKIGAGAVVLKEIPENCTVVGVPGRIVKREDKRLSPCDDIDLDQVMMPDPVYDTCKRLAEELCKLEKKVKELEERLESEAL